MKTIECAIGHIEVTDEGEFIYHGGQTDNGWCFKDYKGAFNTQPYNVFVKIKRDKPEYWPWQRVLGVYFHIEKYPKELGGGWHIKSWADTSDKYMVEKFGTGHLRCDDRKTFIKILKK